jgi:ferredoxin
MAARYTVDRERCIGCGLCRERAPENIDVPRGDLIAVVFKQPESDDEEACREAAGYCPTGGLDAEVHGLAGSV